MMQTATEIVLLYRQYAEWLNTTHDARYGQMTPGAYGGGVSPSFEGFISWLDDHYGVQA